MGKRKAIEKPNIRVENSAPSQRRSAFSVRWAAPILRKEGATRIADFGSGTLRNLSVQERTFYEVTLVETERRCKILKLDLAGKNHIQLQTTREFEVDHSIYDAIFLISVLHTIPNPRYRQKLVKIIGSKVRPGGFIVVDVPQSETYYLRRFGELPRYEDGYLLRWGGYYTFYKNFYSDELDDLFLRTPGIQLFKKIRYCKHLIRIWKRQN